MLPGRGEAAAAREHFRYVVLGQEINLNTCEVW
jgi:hypothetical protein